MTLRLALMLQLASCAALAPDTDYAEMPLADGASVDKVTWYQGVEKVLYNDTGTRTGGLNEPPMIIDRPGLLRVFVSPSDSDTWFARNLAVLVRVTGGPEPLEQVQFINVWGDWLEEDLGKTANFRIPAEYVTADVDFEVEVHEVYPWRTADQGGTDDATWQSEGLRAAQTGPIRLHLVPVRYTRDGSNRLPDTSDAALDSIRDRLFATYPTTQVQLVVEPPINFNGTISANGGLNTLLAQIETLRATSGVPSTDYFYGLVNPAPTFDQFCQGGCTTGLSAVPFSPTEADQRVSVGVGFPGVGEDTLIHEVGHAHGRQHAPCGGAPASDPSFPYPNGGIVAWGYDLTRNQLIQPGNHVDFMSYCDPVWISDYTFSALAEWIPRVEGLARSDASLSSWQMLMVHPDGHADIGVVRERAGVPGGEPVEVALYDADGAMVGVEQGFLTPFDHEAGGFVLVPPLPDGVVDALLLED